MDLPARIGRYEIVEPLGQGGMGRVLLARDSVLGRKVALKILRDDLGIGPEVKASLFERMRQEAKAAAALSHPNMVTLHDMGEEESVGLYLVFEHIDGPTLRERLRDGALPPQEVAALARQLGGALARAHAAGVIHRDVKPENVMLSATGAKITDFGIARLPDSTLTRVGAVLGTPAYSAPEALTSGDFGPASDQFSLAATLYEALSGKRAFPGDDALAVASRVTTDTPTPLGTFTAADLVLARGMAKDKTKRFESCEAFGEALATALERREAAIRTPTWRLTADRISESPGPRSSLVPRSTRRWQNIIAAVAVLVIAALIMVGRRQATSSGASLREVAEAFSAAIAARPAPAPSASSRARPVAPPSASSSASPSASAAPSGSGPSPSTSAPVPPSAPSASTAPSASATSQFAPQTVVTPPLPSSSR